MNIDCFDFYLWTVGKKQLRKERIPIELIPKEEEENE